MPSDGTEQRKLAAIMFTDMVGYSALAQRNEALALELLEEHRRVLRSIFPKHNGREIETAGDAFLVEFVSALEAVRCAVEIQETLSGRNRTTPTERAIRIRIGIHVGDVVHREGKVMGDAVNIAARIEPLASPGGICVSEDVARQIHNKLDHALVTLGPGELKNIELPVVICRVVLPWEKQDPSSTERIASDHGRRRKRPLVLATVAFLILAGVCWLLVHQLGKGSKQVSNPLTDVPPPPVAASATDQKSIAVLPFVNLSPDKADEYLSDGLTEEILNNLTKLTGLKVVSRTSSFAFKDKKEDIRRIGQQLNVGTVLEGSVRKAGSRVRITAKLITIADGFHLWSETYDRELADIFAIQSDVAQRVAEALKGQLLAGERQQLTRKPTENLEAYELYLKGRYYAAKVTEEGLKKGVEFYQKAIQLDSNYALAYAGLADAYGSLGGVFGFLSPKETFPKTRAAAMKAIDLDETLAEAHTALADCKLRYEWNWEEAERGFKRALELNPNYSLAHFDYGSYLQAQGRFSEAIAARKQAHKLEPLSPGFTANVGYPHYFARQYEQSIACYREALDMDPNYFWANLWLGQVFVQQGHYDQAILEMKKAVERSGRNVRTVASLAHAYAVSGRKNEALSLLDELKQRRANDYVAPYFIALVHAGLGQTDEAFEWLDKAYEERFPSLYLLKVEPVFDHLRSDPRFIALLKKIGLEK